MNVDKLGQYSSLFLGLIFVLMVRGITLLSSQLYTFAYDYGLYLHEFKDLTFRLDRLISPVIGGYSNPFFYLLTFLPFSDTLLLDISFILGLCLIAITLFYFFKPNFNIGVIAVLLFGISIAQNEVFFMFLWKTTLGILLLLINFKIISNRQWKILPLGMLLLFFSHRTSFIIFLFTYIIFLFFTFYKEKRFYILLLSITVTGTVGAFLLYFFREPVNYFLNITDPAVRNGIFINFYHYLLYSLPYIPFAALGLRLYVKRDKSPILPIFFFVTFFWILIQLPFYNRVVVYLDLSIILFAAYFLGDWSSLKVFKYKVGIILFIILSFLIINLNLNREPLITEIEVNEIIDFTQLLEGGFVLAIDSLDAPWLLGFSENVQIGAPGLFDDNRDFNSWLKFWEGEEQEEFLNGYPKPLYIYQRSTVLNGDIVQCLEQKTLNFYHYICD